MCNGEQLWSTLRGGILTGLLSYRYYNQIPSVENPPILIPILKAMDDSEPPWSTVYERPLFMRGCLAGAAT